MPKPGQRRRDVVDVGMLTLGRRGRNVVPGKKMRPGLQCLVNLVLGPDDKVSLFHRSKDEVNLVLSHDNKVDLTHGAEDEIDLVAVFDDEVNLVLRFVDKVDFILCREDEVDLAPRNAAFF